MRLFSRIWLFIVTARRRWCQLTARIDLRSSCPACGDRHRHGIKFMPEARALILSCRQCQAQWGQQPLVDPKTWVAEVSDAR